MVWRSFPLDWGLAAVLAIVLANLSVLAMDPVTSAQYALGLRVIAGAAAVGLGILWRVRYVQRTRAKPGTFREEIAQAVQRIRKFVARAKSCPTDDELIDMLASPEGQAVIALARQVKLRLRSALHNPEATRELTALETWPDDALAHMADTFERMIPLVDPTLLASP
jgi:hypothetical protein